MANRVNMQDACDAATFNVVLGDGTCNRQGGMKFDQFIAMLTKLGVAGPWHFASKTLTGHVAPGATYHEEEPLEAGTTARFQC
jgi:hypothetical protein